ncbi:MAG: phosphate acyltransferase PlsX [Bacteroidota bacterium]
MKIGIDILGGDFAPDANIAGAVLAKKELPQDCNIVLLGDQDQILGGLSALGASADDFIIVHAPDVITMHDHPTKAIPSKPNSSIAVGFELLARKELNAFASTGNTGAMLVGAMFKLGVVEGISRPCITGVLPQLNGGQGILLDVGTVTDCKPENLFQFALLGDLYAKHVLNISTPRVALLSIGEEDSKGNLLTVATNKLLREQDKINFIGNIESRMAFDDQADVIVCDGFIGNVMLKQAEGIYTLMQKRGIQDAYFDRYNYENYGGTPILGVKGNVIIGHGISNDIAVKNMIKHAYEVAKSGLASKINEAFN